MSAELHKFPRTPHLCWLGKAPARDDKLLAPHEADAFLDGEVIAEEKVDGANLGLSLASDGTIRFQNRGNFLEGKLTGQFAPLRGWAARQVAPLRQHLPPGAVLFGEWCFAQHSIRYTKLPDWFLGFDLLETAPGLFWSTDRRNALLVALGLARIRPVARGRFTRREVLSLLDEKSAYADAPLEGLYLRRESGGCLTARAKLVRAEFTQAIGEHWSKGRQISNALRKDLEQVPALVGRGGRDDSTFVR